MKIKLFLSSLFLLMLINTGCEKSIFDYRKKYLGDYDFVYDTSTWSMGVPPTISSTTVHEHQEIGGYLDFGDEGEIDVYFEGGFFKSLIVDKKGNISINCSPSSKIGEFTSKNHFKISYGSSLCHDGQGSEISYTLEGTKE